MGGYQVKIGRRFTSEAPRVPVRAGDQREHWHVGVDLAISLVVIPVIARPRHVAVLSCVHVYLDVCVAWRISVMARQEAIAHAVIQTCVHGKSVRERAVVEKKCDHLVSMSEYLLRADRLAYLQHALREALQNQARISRSSQPGFAARGQVHMASR